MDHDCFPKTGARPCFFFMNRIMFTRICKLKTNWRLTLTLQASPALLQPCTSFIQSYAVARAQLVQLAAVQLPPDDAGRLGRELSAAGAALSARVAACKARRQE